MLLNYNSEKVIDLVKNIENLKNIDKVRLAIYLLENKDFSVDNFDIEKLIALLKEILSNLDPNYGKVITNFAIYKNLMLILAKYMELPYLDKKKFSIESLFNIYESDFKDDTINKKINEELNIYDYSFSLNIDTKQEK